MPRFYLLQCGYIFIKEVLDPQVTSFLTSQPFTSGKPKAYLNWILFDERFKLVATSSEAEQVDGSGAFKTYNKTSMPVEENGYLYIYVSNETNYDVFFDNLQVTHMRGSLLEESHYYPFGLTMAGISSKALGFGGAENKYKYNGIEQNNDFDLNMYDAFYRNLDPQTGRFWQIDPKPDVTLSLYSAMGNNPIRYNDPLGDTLNFPDASTEFKANFNIAKQHLLKHKVGQMLTNLENHPEHVSVIENQEGKSSYDPETNTLNWDPTAAMVYTDEKNNQVVASPTSVLNHEIDHALDDVKNPEIHKKRADTPDKQYDTKEERRVITGSEQKTALALGEIKKGQVTRRNHGGGYRRVNSPTATKDVVVDKAIELIEKQRKIPTPKTSN